MACALDQVHKTANVLDKLPKSVQPAAKADLREIWTSPDRATAETAITTFAGMGVTFRNGVEVTNTPAQNAA